MHGRMFKLARYRASGQEATNNHTGGRATPHPPEVRRDRHRIGSSRGYGVVLALRVRRSQGHSSRLRSRVVEVHTVEEELETTMVVVVQEAGAAIATKIVLLPAECTMAAAALAEAVETTGRSWPQTLPGPATNLSMLMAAGAEEAAEPEGFLAVLGGWEVFLVDPG